MFSAALLCLTVFLALVVQRRDKGSPLMWGLVLWCLLFATQLINPMGLRGVGWEASLVLGVGLLSLSAPTLMRRRGFPITWNSGESRPVLLRLILACAVTALLAGIGVYEFRAGVSGAVGADISQLTPSQIRAAQTGAARGGGLLALLAGLNPLLACLGIYGYLRFSRMFGLVTIAALGASLQTPARLSTVMLVVQATIFYYYCRRSIPLRGNQDLSKPGIGRIKLLMLGGAASIASITFFNLLGSQLGKVDTAAAYFPQYSWPSWTLSPLLYLTGGYPALSQAITSGTDPFEHPNSVFLLARIWASVDPLYHAPDTLAGYVPIPVPFNVYTGFGQVWYDFGFIGTIILSALLGILAVSSHRRAMAGQLQYAWTSSLVASLLLAMPQTYRLFFLDVDLALACGFLFFAWLPRTQSRLHVGGPGRLRSTSATGSPPLRSKEVGSTPLSRTMPPGPRPH